METSMHVVLKLERNFITFSRFQKVTPQTTQAAVLRISFDFEESWYLSDAKVPCMAATHLHHRKKT